MTENEETYVKYSLAAEVLRLLNSHDRQLEHHSPKSIPAQFLGNAAHDQFMGDGADDEGDEDCYRLGEVCAGWVVDVAAEEVVDGDVPFTGEFEPS